MRVLVFDTETTELTPNRTLPLNKQPHVIEYYSCAVDLATGEVTDETEFLIKPPRLFSAEEKKISRKSHGLTDEDLAEMPFFSAVADPIRAAIECGLRPLAHNASFDLDMMEIEYERLGQTIKFGGRPICTVEATIHIKGYRLSLGGLHEYLFGETFNDKHRARSDVAALSRCACELYRRGEL